VSDAEAGKMAPVAPLDRLIPAFDAREQHQLRVDAPPERALAAALAVTPTDAPLLRLLFRLRGLSVGDRPVWESMQTRGFQQRGEGVLVGVGRPWTVRGGLRQVEDPASFAERGYAVMGMSFAAEEGLLRTETRVRLTDAAARRRFRAYWLVVRPFSGLVRRSWLAAARRRAEGG
jgi:hypothetical protein